jgi:hypothetical protein
MAKKNPFKDIEPEESVPESLKDQLLREIEGIIAENQDDEDAEAP